MLLKLTNFFFKYKEKILLTILLLSYLVCTLPAVFSDKHILYNLEPYPDGMLYTLSAQNFIQGNGLNLTYNGTVLPLWVPPLYPLVLSIGYLIWSVPQSFYLTNIFLQLLSISLLFFLVLKLTKSTTAAFFSSLAFLAHAYVFWLPTVPMTENIVLPLVFLAVSGVLLKITPRTASMTLIGNIGLLVTRLSVAPLVSIILLLFFLKLAKNTSKKKISMLVITLLVGISVIFSVLKISGNNADAIVYNFFSSLLHGGIFYNVSFTAANLDKYIQILLGKPSLFLWLPYPLTSVVMSASALGFLLFSILKKEKQNNWNSIVLLVIFLAQFPLLVIFYTVDARYLLSTIPIFAITFGLLIHYVEEKYSMKVAIVTGCCILILHSSTQLPLFKEVLSFNILHRSTAWQYQAIKEFDGQFSKIQDGQLITALPPFLVSAYQQSNYQVLPLSQDQEFLHKKEFVWGKDVPYDDLIAGYTLWLQQGRKLYISNAYITHQQSVIRDYEEYKKYFDFVPVSTGCLDACNIYELRLKNE